MPLENFGSILNFAENLECQDLEFYELVATNPACAAYKSAFEELATDIGEMGKTGLRLDEETLVSLARAQARQTRWRHIAWMAIAIFVSIVGLTILS